MGLFNEFEKNNSNTSPATSQNLIRKAPYLTNQERNRLRSNAVRLKQNNIQARITNIVGNKLKRSNLSRMKISPLQISVFNGIVNTDAKKGEYSVDVKDILYKKPFKRTPVAPGSALEIEVDAIKLLYGRMQIGAKHTFTVIPNANARNRHQYFVAQIDGRIFEDGQEKKFLIKIYTNGKMQVAGGMINSNDKHPEIVRKYIVDKYVSKYKFLYNPNRYATLVGTFQANGVIDLTGVARAFSKSGNVNYEPELRPALKMTHYGTNFQLFRSGKIQIMGAKTMKSLQYAYNIVGYDLVKSLRVMGFMNGFINMVNKAPVKVRRVKKDTANTTNAPISYVNKKNSKNSKNGIRIGPRKCATIDRPKLISAAEKIGIVDITRKTTKPQICDKIKNRVFGTFKVDNIPCKAYTKEKLLPIAVAKGINVTDSDTVDTLCEKLKIPTQIKTTNKEKRSIEAVKKKLKNKNETLKKRVNKRRISNDAIKKDLEMQYGKKWLTKYKDVMPSLNSDAREVRNRINALSNKNKNKAGIPFKGVVDKIKRDAVRSWKFNRVKNLNNKLNNMNNNLAKELENVMNVNGTPSPTKKKTVFLKGTKVEQL